MKLLVLTQHYPPDICSTGFLCSQVAEHRAAQGDAVTVVTGRVGYTGGGVHATAWRTRVHHVRSTAFGRGTLAGRLLDQLTFYLAVAWRLLRLGRQDVILTVTTPPLMPALAALLHPRAKLVLWSMDCYPEVAERVGVVRPGGLTSRLWRGLNRWLYRRLAAVVCLDSAMRELLRPYDTQCRVQFPVIPNWEPERLFRDLPKPRAGIATPGKLTVLYMGNAGYGHEFETVQEAAALLVGQPIEFVFIGGGRRWGELRPTPNVRLLEYLNLPKEETPAVLRCGALSLITLRDEMLGVMSPSKLHAALASGVGVAYVGPAGSNVAEAIERHGCGFSVPVGCAQQLAAKLANLAQDRAAVAEYGLRASAAFRQDYSDTVALPQFGQLFQEILAQKVADDASQNLVALDPAVCDRQLSLADGARPGGR